MTEAWVPLRVAWERALYGPDGFYRVELPADHFRTSSHASPLFARAVAELARRHGLTSVWDVGAGAGELLSQLHAWAPDLRLTGIELRPRPASLPERVHWLDALPGEYDGLVLANELLDNVACDVVELDPEGHPRIVEVDVATGEHRLGDIARGTMADWLGAWWAIDVTGQRAEVGSAREDVWAQVCADNREGLCLAVDYGHLRESRPFGGSLASYRGGREVEPSFGGGADISASVAFDALAAAVGGRLLTQREALRELGVDGRRPSLRVSATDPQDYLRRLGLASEAAELTASPGLGDFWWLLTPCG